MWISCVTNQTLCLSSASLRNFLNTPSPLRFWSLKKCLLRIFRLNSHAAVWASTPWTPPLWVWSGKVGNRTTGCCAFVRLYKVECSYKMYCLFTRIDNSCAHQSYLCAVRLRVCCCPLEVLLHRPHSPRQTLLHRMQPRSRWGTQGFIHIMFAGTLLKVLLNQIQLVLMLTLVAQYK